MKFAKVLALSFWMCLLPIAANADITYDFQAFSSGSVNLYGINDPVQLTSGSFQLTVPTFISANQGFTPGQLNSSTINTTGATLILGNVGFGFIQFDLVTKMNVIDFGGSLADGSAGVGWRYFFPDGAFTAVGSYDTIFPGDYQAAHLNITGVPTSNAPLPGALLLLGSGLAGLAAFRRSRKN